MRILMLTAAMSLLVAGCAANPSAPIEPGYSEQRALLPRDLSVTPLNAPASQFPSAVSTAPTGIRGILLTATVALQGGATAGAIYRTDTKAWQQVLFPGAASTAVYGPDLYSTAYRLVGSYKQAGAKNDHGFVYDAVTKKYTTIDAPAALCAPKQCNTTIAHSVYGGADKVAIVGNTDAVSAAAASEHGDPFAALGHAFLFDGKEYRNIDVAGAASTTAYGVWGHERSTVVAGGYGDAKGVHAYVRELDSRKNVLVYDYPGSKLTHFEGITGLYASGRTGAPGNYNVVGDYTDAKDGAVYGFFLQISGWKAGKPLVIGKLSANSVSDRTVVGVYNDAGSESGYTIGIPIIDPP
jgi:hypothetical protein